MENTKPTVRTDTDSLGRAHNRSDDGKFTKNPNYGQKEEQNSKPIVNTHETRSNSHVHTGFKEETSHFDKSVSEPCFNSFLRQNLAVMFANDLVEGQVSVATKSTGFEDRVLGIDYFLGNAGQDNQFLIDEPDVDRIDLKTITRGLGGNRDFFDHPRVSIPVLASHEDAYKPLPENLISKHQNNVFAFQVLYSSKPLEQVQSKADIEEAKLYYVKKSAIVDYMNASPLMKSKIGEAFVDKANKFYNLEDMVKEMATQLGLEKPLIKNKRQSTTFVLTDKDSNCQLFLTIDKENGDRSVRFNFPTKILGTDLNLKLNTHKFYKKFTPWGQQ